MTKPLGIGSQKSQNTCVLGMHKNDNPKAKNTEQGGKKKLDKVKQTEYRK